MNVEENNFVFVEQLMEFDLFHVCEMSTTLILTG